MARNNPHPLPADTELGPTAVSYLRVSTSEQARRGGEAEGFSIPIQRDRTAEKAREMSALVVEEFIDAGRSATTLNRPALQELLAYVQAHPVTYLIVYKLDRLARNLMDDLLIRATLKKAGVKLISCSEHVDDSASGELSLNIMGSMNQYHSANLREELKNKLIGKVKAGGTIGKAPIGYLNTITRADGIDIRSVAVDEERAPLVQWAFEQYATGEWSLSSLTEALEAKGLTTVPSQKFAKKPVPRSTVARMLRKPYYTGKLAWKGVLYDGNQPALVPQEVFDAVQDVLDAHNVVGEKQRVHNHYLKGSVRCGSCGSKLCITRTVNRHGSEYLYFFCLGNYRRYRDCTQRAIPVELVETHIEKKWLAVRFSADYAEAIRSLLTDELTGHRQHQERDKARALKRRMQLVEERRKLLNAHYMDAIPLELLKEEQERITKELAESEKQIAAAEIALDRVEALMRRSLSFLTNCYETYIMASPQLRRQLNQAVFDAFFVTTDGAIMAKPTYWFRSLLRTDALTPRSGRGAHMPASGDLHDSREWQDGLPAWLAVRESKQGSDSSRRPTPVLSGLGLNKDYLAERGGFEPPVGCPTHDFQSCRFGRSRTSPGPVTPPGRPRGYPAG